MLTLCMLCYIMLCYVMLCYVMLCNTVSDDHMLIYLPVTCVSLPDKSTTQYYIISNTCM